MIGLVKHIIGPGSGFGVIAREIRYRYLVEDGGAGAIEFIAGGIQRIDAYIAAEINIDRALRRLASAIGADHQVPAPAADPPRWPGAVRGDISLENKISIYVGAAPDPGRDPVDGRLVNDKAVVGMNGAGHVQRESRSAGVDAYQGRRSRGIDQSVLGSYPVLSKNNLGGAKCSQEEQGLFHTIRRFKVNDSSSLTKFSIRAKYNSGK